MAKRTHIRLTMRLKSHSVLVNNADVGVLKGVRSGRVRDDWDAFVKLQAAEKFVKASQQRKIQCRAADS